MKSLSLIIMLIISGQCLIFSQDSLLLLNGKYLTGQIKDINDTIICFRSNGLVSSNKFLYKDELFSVKQGVEEFILYKPDTSDLRSYTVEQMSFFIKGQQDARKSYHAPFATAGGFLAGATGAFMGFWGMTTIPATYVFLTGIKTPKCNLNPELKEIMIYDQSPHLVYGKSNNVFFIATELNDIENIECYKLGYKTAAKDKKIKNAVFGSITGMLTVFAATLILVAK